MENKVLEMEEEKLTKILKDARDEKRLRTPESHWNIQ